MLNELNQSTVAAQVEVERECCALRRMNDVVGGGSILSGEGRAGLMEGV
jgi:hypothetical protein